MKIREVDYDSDLEVLTDWWERQDNAPLSEKFLGQFGIMAEMEGKPCGASWLIQCSNNTAMMLFTVCNPDLPWEERKEVIIELESAIEGIAKDMAYENLVVFSENKRLSEKMVELGFTKIDQVDFLVRKL